MESIPMMQDEEGDRESEVVELMAGKVKVKVAVAMVKKRKGRSDIIRYSDVEGPVCHSTTTYILM
jgi:hypothetical protein